MADQIHLDGLRVVARVGVPDAELASPQPLVLDLVLHLDLTSAATSDDVADTADYGMVTEAVARAVAGPNRLLERVAHLAIEAALDADHRIDAVTATVRKVRPPVPVDLDTAAVRLHRTRP